MIKNRNIEIITDKDGKKHIVINDIRFKGKRKIDWDDVARYLKGYVAKAKANSATAIPELIQIATNPKWEENRKEKHNKKGNEQPTTVECGKTPFPFLYTISTRFFCQESINYLLLALFFSSRF